MIMVASESSKGNRVVRNAPGLKAGGNFKILYPAGRFTISESNGNGNLVVFPDAGSPKPVCHLHRRERHGPDGIVFAVPVWAAARD